MTDPYSHLTSQPVQNPNPEILQKATKVAKIRKPFVNFVSFCRISESVLKQENGGMRALASLGGKSLPPSNSDFSDRL